MEILNFVSLTKIKNKRFFEDESDFFCLLQVGIFRSNVIEIDEFKAFLEILIVDVLGVVK